MLHTLLVRNPSKDILLHVSVNNPAMVSPPPLLSYVGEATLSWK